MKTGIELIAEERQRQIEKEGYTDSHDADHDKGELAGAGAAYIVDYFVGAQLAGGVKSTQLAVINQCMPMLWPFEGSEFKRTHDDPIRQLVKGIALAVAEIDRLQNASKVVESKKKWRLIGWDWEDSEFTIELGSGEKKLCELPDGDDQTWLLDEFNRLVREDIFAPTDNPDDPEEMAWTGKENPWRDYSELPEWITTQLNDNGHE